MTLNKYFIGFELPAEHRLKLVKAQELAKRYFEQSTTRVLGMDDFHITALYLGGMPREQAEAVINDMSWGFGRIEFRFDGAAVFDGRGGPHALVLKLHDMWGGAELLHKFLKTSKHFTKMQHGKWPYNPHITLAKADGPADNGLFHAHHVINVEMLHNVTKHEFRCEWLSLFEKAEGATSYTPHRVLQIR